MVSAIVFGWLVGIMLKVHELIVGTAVSVLAGGIIMNVFKDELPDGKSSNYQAFAGGVVLISFLTMLLQG